MGNIKRVFVASPCDVIAERLKVKEVIDEINKDLPIDFDCRYEFVGWEGVDSRIGVRPQAVITEQADVKNVDIFIGILWSRFGTLTGGKDKDGREYGSGTEEEFDIAFENYKRSGVPHIMFFRNTKDIPNYFDQTQKEKVNEFFRRFGPNEEHRGLYDSYNDIDEFKTKVRRAILRDAFKNYKGCNVNYIDFINELVKDGFLKIFTAKNKFERNEEKKLSIKKTKELKLIAHSGHSFISLHSRIFRDLIEDKLQESDFKFKIILTNPWSDSGFYFALGNQTKEDLCNLYENNSYGIKSFANSIKVLEKWYENNFRSSIEGYQDLRKEFGDRVQLKLIRYDIPASILITDNDCYYESYLPIKHLERIKRGMITFEMKVSSESSLYKNSDNYFDFLWTISDDYSIYAEKEKLYKQVLKDKEKFLKKG